MNKKVRNKGLIKTHHNARGLCLVKYLRRKGRHRHPKSFPEEAIELAVPNCVLFDQGMNSGHISCGRVAMSNYHCE